MECKSLLKKNRNQSLHSSLKVDRMISQHSIEVGLPTCLCSFKSTSLKFNFFVWTKSLDWERLFLFFLYKQISRKNGFHENLNITCFYVRLTIFFYSGCFKQCIGYQMFHRNSLGYRKKIYTTDSQMQSRIHNIFQMLK